MYEERVETDAEKDAEARAAEAKAAELEANEIRAAEMTKAAAARRAKWTRAHTKGAEPTEAELLSADTWPKIFGNINVPPIIVYGPEEAEQLGSAWVEVDLAGHGYTLTPAP
jgi:hypothetical protein